MSLAACAELVARADPERFRATMVAPVAARAVLFPIYAFNVEVTRAPRVTQEAMIAEMRLQWWRDALEEMTAGGPVRKHEVVDPLAQVLAPEQAQVLDALVAARRWDIYKDAFEDAAHLADYIDATSGHLMWVAARSLGAADEGVVRDFAFGAGVANLLQAVPALEAEGRKPLVDGRASGVAALAREGLTRLDRARAARAQVSDQAAPALVAGYLARPVLRAAIAAPGRVAAGALGLSPLRKSLRFAHVSLRGWWR